MPPSRHSLVLALGLLSALSSTLCRADDRHELLAEGKYKELLGKQGDRARDGAWAFARYFLVPDKAVYQAAREADLRGDLLGTFVLMRCHTEGVGVRRDPKVRWACNVKLREALEKRDPRSKVDSYMLAYLSQADETGTIDQGAFDDIEDAYRVAGKSNEEHLLDSAEAGFAQAMVEVGLSEQNADPASATGWYRKAAELGHAGGMKDLGYMLATGKAPGGKRDEESMRWTRKAADGGDVYAMINVAAFPDQLGVEGGTAEGGRRSIDRAVGSGHPAGALEKGLALLVGNYGFEIDRPAGLALWQKAADSGSSFVLGQLAYFYATGLGVDIDYQMAARLGKAAWLQGRSSSVKTVAACYERDEELAKDEAAANYWGLLAMGGGLAFAMGESEPKGKVAAELEKLDPFAIKLR